RHPRLPHHEFSRGGAAGRHHHARPGGVSRSALSHDGSLWPPNHAMREIDLAECGVVVSDGCSGGAGEATSLAITCVSSDEPAAGGGPPGADIEWIDDTRVRVRAERSGRGDGRVYRIHFVARDGAGN